MVRLQPLDAAGNQGTIVDYRSIPAFIELLKSERRPRLDNARPRSSVPNTLLTSPGATHPIKEALHVVPVAVRGRGTG